MQDSVGPMAADAGSVLTLLLDDPGEGGVREVPLRFLVIEGRFHILAAADPLPRWLARLRAAPRARWRIGDALFEGTVHDLEDAERTRSQFEASFGRGRVERWLGPRVTGLSLMPDGAPIEPRRQLEAYFDRAAAEYDRLVEGNPLDRLLRMASLEILRRCFHRGDQVLEIGSGTGLETLPLAATGVRVVATDISAAMLERLKSKAAAQGLADHVEARHLPVHRLGELEGAYPAGRFQGAFSTFGALNCEPAWKDVAPVLARLVSPAGAVVLGVWNRVCLFELSAYAIAGRPRRALARLASPAPVGLTRFGVPVRASSVGEYVRAFAPSFEVESVLGLPVVLPPYDWIRHVPNPDAFLPLLAALDERIRPRFPFNRLGDHFVLVLRRKARGAA